MSRRPLSVLLLALMVSANGCALFQKKRGATEEEAQAAKPEPRVERATVPERVGKITLVNEDGRFVLIDLDQGQAPDQGSALKAMRNGAETAVLAVGDVRRRPFIVADIVSGEPLKGDAVYR